MSLPSRLLGANPSIQVSTLLSGSLSTPSAKQAFIPEVGNFESIASYTLTSDTATSGITFSSISTDYVLLQIHLSVRTNRSDVQDSLLVRINNDSTSSYYSNYHISNGSAATIGYGTNSYIGNSGFTGTIAGNNAPNANIFSTCIVKLFNSNSTTQYKGVEVLSGIETNSSDGRVGFVRGTYTGSLNAITSLSFAAIGSSFMSGTKIALYGLKV